MSSTYCTNCGSILESNYSFCDSCGTPSPIRHQPITKSKGFFVILLLFLLGIRFVFQVLYLLLIFDVFLIIFAIMYLIAMIGVYNDRLYGPITAMIVGTVDILIALTLQSSEFFFAIIYDIGFIILSLKIVIDQQKTEKAINKQLDYGEKLTNKLIYLSAILMVISMIIPGNVSNYPFLLTWIAYWITQYFPIFIIMIVVPYLVIFLLVINEYSRRKAKPIFNKVILIFLSLLPIIPGLFVGVGLLNAWRLVTYNLTYMVSCILPLVSIIKQRFDKSSEMESITPPKE